MNNLKIIKKDLFSADDNLCHGVNCHGAFGAGIAIKFKEEFYEMFNRYRKICKDEKLKPGMMFVCNVNDDQYKNRKYVFNLAIKDHWKEDATYEAIKSSITRMVFFMSKNNVESVAMPWIGCGLGGLEKDKVYKIIEDIIKNKNVKISIYEI